MKEEDKKRIQEALNLGKSPDEVQAILRELVSDKVLQMVSDGQRDYWKSMCNTVQFPLKLKCVGVPVSVPATRKTTGQLPWRKYAGVTTAAAVFWLTERITEGHHLSSFLLSLASGAVVEHFANPISQPEQDSVETKIVVASTLSEIEDSVNRFVKDVEMLKDSGSESTYPMENRYSQVLEWMQNVYLDSEDYGEECARFFRKRVASMMYLSGYELVFYSEETKSCFETEKSHSVKNDFQMVLPAVRNVKTNEVIFKGKTFLPMT